jgi:hypothetical protein
LYHYLQLLFVGVDDALSSIDIRVFDITVQREAMIYNMISKVSRDTAEAVNWEQLVIVVAFEDTAYRSDCMLVLIVSI